MKWTYPVAAAALAVWLGILGVPSCDGADDGDSTAVGGSGAAGGAGGGHTAGGGAGGVAGSGVAGTGGAAGAGGLTSSGGGVAGSGGSAGAGGTGFPSECTLCHGALDSPAPPPDTVGNSDTTIAGVGAHQAHFQPSTWHRQVSCNQCHPVPSQPDDPAVPTHNDGTTDLSWGPVAKQGSYDSVTHTCTNTYCHGDANMPPDIAGVTTNRSPEWTLVDGTQVVCGEACHSLPPGGTHFADTACHNCHISVIAFFNAADPAASQWVNPSNHINGTWDL